MISRKTRHLGASEKYTTKPDPFGSGEQRYIPRNPGMVHAIYIGHTDYRYYTPLSDSREKAPEFLDKKDRKQAECGKIIRVVLLSEFQERAQNTCVDCTNAIIKRKLSAIRQRERLQALEDQHNAVGAHAEPSGYTFLDDGSQKPVYCWICGICDLLVEFDSFDTARADASAHNEHQHPKVGSELIWTSES